MTEPTNTAQVVMAKAKLQLPTEFSGQVQSAFDEAIIETGKVHGKALDEQIQLVKDRDETIKQKDERIAELEAFASDEAIDSRLLIREEIRGFANDSDIPLELKGQSNRDLQLQVLASDESNPDFSTAQDEAVQTAYDMFVKMSKNAPAKSAMDEVDVDTGSEGSSYERLRNRRNQASTINSKKGE